MQYSWSILTAKKLMLTIAMPTMADDKGGGGGLARPKPPPPSVYATALKTLVFTTLWTATRVVANQNHRAHTNDHNIELSKYWHNSSRSCKCSCLVLQVAKMSVMH